MSVRHALDHNTSEAICDVSAGEGSDTAGSATLAWEKKKGNAETLSWRS